MKQKDYILNNETEVLQFLKSKYPLYHLSNVFFRDIQYGIQTMLYRKGMSLGYSGAETLAKEFVAQLEKKKVLSPIDKQSWVLNYPQFKKPLVAPPSSTKAAAKPAGAAPAAPRFAGSSPGAPKPSLPPISRPGASASKPGGLPPLSRPSAGPAAPKPGGLPPLNRPAAGAAPAQSAAPKAMPVSPQQHPEAPEPEPAKEASAPAGAPSTDAPPAAAPPSVGQGQGSAGGRKPLPPLGGRTPSGPKK